MPNWGQVLHEIQQFQLTQSERIAQETSLKNKAVDEIRKKYLKLLFEKTGRNIISYYSGWLSKPGIAQQDITDEDKNGFMMAVHQLDKTLGLDLVIHTPGGHIAATQSIVDYLHKMFQNNIRCVVPQIAMSAGTMIACSCKEILLGKHSNLGPIDPQYAGVPAYGVLEEFRKAYSEVKKDPDKIKVWQPILGKYHPTFLGECQNAIRWSNDFVRNELANNMFKGEPDGVLKAGRVVKALSNYRKNRSHSRHIHVDECIGMGLKVIQIEEDKELQDLILTVHHCYMHSLMNTPSFKMIENHNGVAFVKQQIEVAVPLRVT